MALTQELGVTGLWVDPSPQTDAPAGAMDIALDVVFRRAGTVEPRPGFKSGFATPPLDEIKALIPFNGDVVTVGIDGATSKTRWLGGDAILTVATAELSWDTDYNAVRGVEARKNLYITTSDAVRKLTSGSDLLADFAGMPPQFTFYAGSAATTTYSVLTDNTRTAYRAVVRRKDANGLVVRSAPTSRSLAEITTARDASISLYFYDYGRIAAGDVIEVYRSLSVASTLTPSDVMYLAFEITVTSAHIAAGQITGQLDPTLSANLGAALYTNPTREGIERRNQPPMLATDFALYNGSLFASNVTAPYRLQTIIPAYGVATGNATGLGNRNYTGTRTNGSASITGMSSIVGIQVGQLHVWNGVILPVAAVSGTTITMGTVYAGATDGAPVTLSFVDSVRIYNGTTSLYYQANSTGLQRYINDGAGSYTANASVTLILSGTGYYTIDSAQQFVPRQSILFEGLLPSSPVFYVSATHGDEYEPPLALIDNGDGSAGTVATQDVFVNGIAWSKSDQPEHFMLGALGRIGNERSPILRIFSTLDGLWILKGRGDGLYRLTGFGERSGWSWKQVDASLYLLHPKLACQMGDKVYAWTNRGAVEISDSGINELSTPAISTLTALFERTIDAANAEQVYCIANEKDNEVIWQLGIVESISYATYVFNTLSRAWSTWFADSSATACAAYDPSTGLISLGRTDSGTTRIERGISQYATTAFNADREFSVTVATATTTAITINGGSGWTPAVGDVVVQSSVYYVVTAITSATEFTVHLTGLTAAAATAYEAFESSMRWLPKTAPGVAVAKRAAALTFHWETSGGVRDYTVTAQSSQDGYGSTTSLAYSLTYDTDHSDAIADYPRETRALLPRGVAIGPRLRPGLKIKTADARWRVSGVSIESEPLGTRVAR